MISPINLKVCVSSQSQVPNESSQPTEACAPSLEEKPDLLNYMVQTEVGTGRNLRWAVVNSALGATCVIVTLG